VVVFVFFFIICEKFDKIHYPFSSKNTFNGWPVSFVFLS